MNIFSQCAIIFRQQQRKEGYRIKAKYESPEAEVILFDAEDVITASGEGSGDEAGHTTGAEADTRLPRI